MFSWNENLRENMHNSCYIWKTKVNLMRMKWNVKTKEDDFHFIGCDSKLGWGAV